MNPYLCIICNSRENANELADSLNKEGIKVGMIHGGLTPRERKQQMKRIRNLDSNTLLQVISLREVSILKGKSRHKFRRT